MKITFKHEIKSSDDVDADKLVKLILGIRKINNSKEFMNPPSPMDIRLEDFDAKYKSYFRKTITLLKEIKKQQKMIVVYTDYDADGITGGAILWETLHLLGFRVMPYVPDRKTEGYGFSVTGIDNVISQFDPALIISVDHGITKIKEVEYAASRGVKIIITDHHLKGEEIPEKAEAIFHIPVLSGSGVSYFFSKAVYDALKDNATNGIAKLGDNFASDYAALASIGTIADLIPLVGPSRALVSYGLKTFPKIKRFGIVHILKQSGIEGKPITPYEVGFIIAPRINAIGRLEHAIDALRLLCTVNEERARELALKVGDINTKRQGLVEESVDQAKQMLPKKIGKIIILTSDHWNEGIIGLIASKLLEIHYRPVIIMTKNDGFYKGSARSIPAFHMTDFLRSLKDNLIDVGGHAAAAGFTVEAKKIKQFISDAEKKADDLINEKDLDKTITADLKIPISKVTIKLAEALSSLEPFGVGNPRPVFVSSGVITDANIFGKTGTHLKIVIGSLEFIAFNKANIFEKISRGLKVDIVYNLEIDRWQGRYKLRAKFIDYLAE